MSERSNGQVNEAALRREARRRRILENSESRLKKIVGENDNLPPISSQISRESNTCKSHFDMENSHNTKLPHSHNTSTSVANEDYVEERQSAAIDDFIERNFAAIPNQAVVATVQPNIIQSNKIYLLLGTIAFILMKTGYGFLIQENILIPYIIVQLPRIFLKDKNIPQNSIATLLLLAGVRPNIVTLYSTVSYYLSDVALGFSCYMFTFLTLFLLWGLIF